MNDPTKIREVCLSRMTRLQQMFKASLCTRAVLFIITSNSDTRMLVYLYGKDGRITWQCFDTNEMKEVERPVDIGTLCDVTAMENEYFLNIMPERTFTINTKNPEYIYARTTLTPCNAQTAIGCGLLGIHRMNNDTFAIVGRTQKALLIESYTVTSGQMALTLAKNYLTVR